MADRKCPAREADEHSYGEAEGSGGCKQGHPKLDDTLLKNVLAWMKCLAMGELKKAAPRLGKHPFSQAETRSANESRAQHAKGQAHARYKTEYSGRYLERFRRHHEKDLTRGAKLWLSTPTQLYHCAWGVAHPSSRHETHLGCPTHRGFRWVGEVSDL